MQLVYLLAGEVYYNRARQETMEGEGRLPTYVRNGPRDCN